MSWNHVIYLFLSIGGASLSFFKLGYLASLLDPIEFGQYSLVIISYIYIGYVGSMGSNEYMLKVGSAAQNNSQRITIRNISLSYSILGVIILSSILIIFSYIIDDVDLTNLITSMIILACCAQPYNIFESFYRSSQKIISFSLMLFCKSVLVLFFLYIFVESYGFYGAIISEACALLVISIVCFVVSYSEFKGSRVFDDIKNKIKVVISEGFPFCMATMLRNLSVSFERYIVSILFGMSSLGLYSFLMILYQGSVLGCGILMNALGPKLINLSHQKGSNRQFIKMVTMLFVIVILVSIVIYPVFYIITPIIIKSYFLPYYESNIISMLTDIYLLCVVSFLLFISDWILLSLSKEKLARNLTFLSLTFVAFTFIYGLYKGLELSTFIEIIVIIRFLMLVITSCFLYKYFVGERYR
ncbi:oligosaccharide flippase family protein [Vibrio bivalvicida]|uniref:Oligosaccharide flippase family protein n=1 Tax=Vibrio bivalvicida TaxID=1276888 RepID=A0ABV4MP44_9VIBR